MQPQKSHPFPRENRSSKSAQVRFDSSFVVKRTSAPPTATTYDGAGAPVGSRRHGARMALALFSELHVRSFQAAKPWYVSLLGESSFVAHDTRTPLS